MLAVRGAGFEPHQVVLEITERTDARKEILIPEAARLRALGFLLALDDVGAGNAGLEMLRALPVDFIKIDRAVVASAGEDRSARAVLLAIMAFARESGSFVIAEGIETEAMLELARDPNPNGESRALGAQGAQGYLLGRPAPVPTEAPSYSTTLATLSVLTAAREHRRIAAALQGGDELYRVLLRTVPDMVVALFDRDMRCQVVDGGIDRIDQWREILEGKTVREALGAGDDGEETGRAAAPRARRRELRVRVARPPQRRAAHRAGRPGARRPRRRDRRDGRLPRPHPAAPADLPQHSARPAPAGTPAPLR